MEQLVARQAHNLEVVGSSPTPATNRSNESKVLVSTRAHLIVWKERNRVIIMRIMMMLIIHGNIVWQSWVKLIEISGSIGILLIK